MNAESIGTAIAQIIWITIGFAIWDLIKFLIKKIFNRR